MAAIMPLETDKNDDKVQPLPARRLSRRRFLKLIARQIAGNRSPAAPVAIRAGRVVACAVDPSASAACRVRDAFFTDRTGHHRLRFFSARQIKIYNGKNGKIAYLYPMNWPIAYFNNEMVPKIVMSTIPATISRITHCK
jgi:hypothetical protein